MTKFQTSPKFKAFADNKKNVIQNLKFALERLENILVKGENAGNQQFLLFPPCFQKAPLSYAGSKEFKNSYSSACHFALVLQLDKEG